MRVQSVHLAGGFHLQMIHRRVGGHQQGHTVVEVEPDMAGGEVVATGAGPEGLGLLDAVAVAVVHARG